MKHYSVNERFHTWQGEGVHMGRSASFIRLHGCPVKCPWCDSAGTWHPDYVPQNVPKESADELASWAAANKPEFVVLTGGEPAIYDLNPLCDALHAKDIPVHIETSGAFELKGSFDWITVSPKYAKLPLDETLAVAHEIKLIVETPETIADWWTRIEQTITAEHIWLHPEWTQAKNPVVLNAISEWVKMNGAPFRAGLQAHKYYNVDSLDKGSRKAVPLGGDEALGY